VGRDLVRMRAPLGEHTSMRRLVLLALLLSCIGCAPATPEAPVPARGATQVAAGVVPAASGSAAAVVGDVSHVEAVPHAEEVPHVVVYGDHVVVEDSAHASPLYFGKADEAFVARAMAGLGAPRKRAGPDECSAGPLVLADYPNGLQLSFQDGRLAGYWVREDARGVATARGVQPGSPRAALGGAELVEASFGSLADLDGMIAVLDEDQRKVAALYAGAVCIVD